MTHQITEQHYTIHDIISIVRSGAKLELHPDILSKVEKGHSYLTKKIEMSDAPFYGINTGFGNLCHVRIDKGELIALQQNLILSHSCGMGDELPEEIVRIMHLLKIIGLAQGHSGISMKLLEYLIIFFNERVVPIVYTQGSLGASGDLAPLANFSLPLLGEGMVYFKGSKMQSNEVLKALSLEPYVPVAKEGLALINGTQFMLAFATWCAHRAMVLWHAANRIGALSNDVFLCRNQPFHVLVHKIRPHKGQIITSEHIRNYREGSALAAQVTSTVQDPYSFRCIPQVHGASYDTFDYVNSVFETEINSVTDNPLIFPEDDEILSGGNFHGQPLALALEFLGLAIHELASISERRTYHLLSGARGLPEFLTKQPGLNSGLMIPQYLAASLVNQNKMYCSPVVADSIVSSNGQEDHVSMGANAAIKCYHIVQNVEKVLAIELMSAAQALECRRPLRSSVKLESMVQQYRSFVAPLLADRLLKIDLDASLQFMQQYDWLS